MATDKKKKKFENIVTPQGIAKYPRLNKPETEVNGQQLETPRFKITLVLNEKDKGVPEFKARIQKLHDAAIAAAEAARQADPKRRKKPLTVVETIRPHLDDEGNEVEGKFEIFAKTAAVTKEGAPKTVPMFDANGHKAKANVGGGSKVLLCVSPGAFDSNLGAGLSLYLNSVQIVELQSFGGGTASSYGFGKVEGGYSADEESGDEDEGDSAEDESDEDTAEETAEDRKPGDF